MTTKELLETLEFLDYEWEEVTTNEMKSSSNWFLYGTFIRIKYKGDVVAKVSLDHQHIYSFSHKGFYMLPQKEKELLHLIVERYSWTEVSKRK